MALDGGVIAMVVEPGLDMPQSTYLALLGTHVTPARGKGRARVLSPVREKLLQLFGAMHGGAVASLVDSAIGMAVNGFPGSGHG